MTAAAANHPPTCGSKSGNHWHSIQSPHHHQNHFTASTDLADDQAPSPQSYPCLDLSTSGDSGVVSHVLPLQLISHYPTTSGAHQVCSRHGNGSHHQHSAPDVHAPVTMVTALTAGTSLKKIGETVREGRLLSDSEEQDDDDEEEEDEIVTAAQLQDMKSRKMSGGYLESVSSWVKMEDGLGRGIDQKELTPNVEQLHSKGRGTVSELMSKVSNSNDNGQKCWSRKSRWRSLGSIIDDKQEIYSERVSSLSRLDNGPEFLVHNESYEHYDINSWRARQPSGSITDGNHSQSSSLHHYDINKAQQPESLHDYDDIKEAAMQPQSLPDYVEITEGNSSLLKASEMKDQEDSGSALDYDYVKRKLLVKLVQNVILTIFGECTSNWITVTEGTTYIQCHS